MDQKKEAVKEIEQLINNGVALKTTTANLPRKSVEALEIAIEALKKQIAKKPNLEGDGYADGGLVYDTWICPHCEIRYEIDYDDYAYCPNCGQAIDWSGEND